MTHWVVLVGPGMSPEALLTTTRLDQALQAVNALVVVAPALRVVLCRADRGQSERVLLVEDGQRTVERPQDLPQPAPAAMQGTSPRTPEPGLEPLVSVGIGGSHA